MRQRVRLWIKILRLPSITHFGERRPWGHRPDSLIESCFVTFLQKLPHAFGGLHLSPMFKDERVDVLPAHDTSPSHLIDLAHLYRHHESAATETSVPRNVRRVSRHVWSRLSVERGYRRQLPIGGRMDKKGFIKHQSESQLHLELAETHSSLLDVDGWVVQVATLQPWHTLTRLQPTPAS